MRAAQLIAAGDTGATADELRSAAAEGAAAAIDPEDARVLHPAYEIEAAFSAAGPELMDLLFRHRSNAPALGAAADREDATRKSASGLRPHREPAPAPPAAYANQPARGAAGGPALIPVLRAHLRQSLPEHMVPTAFVLLEALPLTPNGKIDRGALPAPDRAQRSAPASLQAPQNDLERAIVGLLYDLLSIDEVSVDDNFFDLGANSLMMVQASVRLKGPLGRGVPLVKMFQFPTARSLAAALGAGGGGEERAVKESQDRAAQRQDALQQRGDARAASRRR